MLCKDTGRVSSLCLCGWDGVGGRQRWVVARKGFLVEETGGGIQAAFLLVLSYYSI